MSDSHCKEELPRARLLKMRLVYPLLLLPSFLAALSCRSNSHPVTPPVVDASIDAGNDGGANNDLPVGWLPNSKGNCVFGMPADFISNGGKYHSSDSNLDFQVESLLQSSPQTADQYLNDIFVIPSGNKVLQVVSNEATGMVAMQLLSANPDAQGNRQSSLEFFLARELTICHLSCSSEARNLKQRVEVCLDLADTLSVKN